MQVPREQAQFMYQLVEAYRDYLMSATLRWKENKWCSYLYMYACFHDYLPHIAFWQERDELSQARIANLEQQVATLQVDDDDDVEEDDEW